VREESHLEEMRSAIRGDFERLAERRGDQDLMRVAETHEEPDDESPGPPLADDSEPERASEPEPELEPEPKRSWLSRFLSP
jgi:hypothetical protein